MRAPRPECSTRLVPDPSRRRFIEGLLAIAALPGCDRPLAMDDDGLFVDSGGEPVCEGPFAGGDLLEVVPFVGEPAVTFGELTGEGWDARRMFDLSSLDAETLLADSAAFFVRTATPDRLTTTRDEWVVRGLRRALGAVGQRPLDARRSVGVSPGDAA